MEERVAILLPDLPEFAYAFFGAMKIGAVPVPVNTAFEPRDYEYLLNDSRARILVVSATLHEKITPVRDRLRYLEHVVVCEDGDRDTGGLRSLMREASPYLGPAETNKDDVAFWLYSSGTTGAPKGAIHLHRNMVVMAEAYAKRTLGLRESDLCFSAANLFFAYGLGNSLYFPLSVGATAVLLPEKPAPSRVWHVLEAHQPTVFYSVPTHYAALLHSAEKTGRTSLGRVRLCVSAGEPLPKAIYERWRSRFGKEILDGIGSTELLHIFVSNRPGESRPGSTGVLVPGFEARIVDDSGRDLPPGEEGTLLIKGNSMARGYWNQHEQTRKAFLGEWVNTHDRFRVDEEGYFWYGGRTDDAMKVNGQFVWPSEIEGILLAHPAILESGVVGAPDEEGLTKPRAYVVLKDGFAPSKELARELQVFVRHHAALHKCPKWVEFLETLPKTATGKIRRFMLREAAARLRSQTGKGQAHDG
jgi:benzoate-CoA ligase